MLDFSDTLNPPGKDLILLNSSKYKIRNLLKTSPGENPLNPQIGIQLDIFYKNNTTVSNVSQFVDRYLNSFFCQIAGLTINKDSKGKTTFSIQTLTEETNVSL